MSWSKVKTLLIILFLFLNIFLAYNLYYKNGTSGEISTRTIEETVEILKRNNVEIDKSIISRKTRKIKKVEILNSIDTHYSLAKSLIGECYKTEDGYTGELGEIKYKEVAFEYVNYDKTNKKSITESNAIDVAVKFLKEKGFEIKSADVRDFLKNDKNYIVKFGKSIGDYPVYESYLTVKISSDGMLLGAEGYWPQVKNNSGDTNVEVVNETTVLINLLSLEEFNYGIENTIVDIQLGYTLGSQPETETPILLTLLPSYRVILKNGENYIFDAKTGEFVYKY